jgi:pyridoxal biosynthesis lyase PdxS
MLLQSLGVDESEVPTPADHADQIDKWKFTVPFVSAATNLGKALCRLTEGAAIIRSEVRRAATTCPTRQRTCARSSAANAQLHLNPQRPCRAER